MNKLPLNQIILGDSFEILKEFPEKSIDLIICDPPYGLNYRSNRPVATGNQKDFIANDKPEELIPLINKILPEMIRVMEDDSEIYWFCGGGGSPVLAWAWLEFKKYEPQIKVKNVLVWDKQFIGLGWDWRFQYETIFQLVKGDGIKNTDSSASNVISAKKVIPQAGEHPTPKSIEVISEILKRKPSKVVLDPFLGGGTTALACKLMERDYIGIEIEPKYVEMAKARLSQDLLF